MRAWMMILILDEVAETRKMKREKDDEAYLNDVKNLLATNLLLVTSCQRMEN